MSGEPGTIELDLATPEQLLEPGAPSPFRDGDPLRPEAADWLLRTARGLPGRFPIRIVARVPAGPDTDRIAPAIRAHFASRARSTEKAMADHMADGWRAAGIGLFVFVACLAVAWRLYASLADYPFARIVRESFVILGWVAMWKPVELLLHERLPIARRRRLYRRLARAEIEVVTT
jgi:hypothetical protein